MSYVTFLLSLLLASFFVYLAYYHFSTYLKKSRVVPPVFPFEAPESVESIVDNYSKGVAFEKYVVSKFNRDYFDILDWRGDKSHQGFYAQSNTYPDLVMHYKPDMIDFAVECKWRRHFHHITDKKLNDQLDNYKRFAAEKNIKVFLVIGIGGHSFQPDNLYIVPLRDVFKNCPLFESSFLHRYHKKSGNFYLIPQSIQLT